MKPVSSQTSHSLGQYHCSLSVHADGWLTALLFHLFHSNHSFNCDDCAKITIVFLTLESYSTASDQNPQSFCETETWPDIQYMLVYFLFIFAFTLRKLYVMMSKSSEPVFLFWPGIFTYLVFKRQGLLIVSTQCFNFHTSMWSCSCTQSSGATDSFVINSCIMRISLPI